MNDPTHVHPRWGHVLPLVLALAWLALFWGDWILHASDRMLMHGGVDGIKNYYTLSWYLDHNVSWTTFEGMNHPHGDLTVYTDGHPLLAWVLRLWGIGGGDAVGILNLLLLLSLVPATWLTWDIFKRLHVPATPAAGLALAVCVLMPQWERLGGHFSLSHLWAIPLLVWLLLRAFKHESNRAWTVVYAAVSLALYFTHPYLGLMASGLAVGAALMAAFMPSTTFAASRWRGILTMAGLLPIVAFQSLIWWMDNHLHRPSDPAGFWDNHSQLSGWFLPQHGPLAMWFADLSDVRWEVKGYVGVAAVVLVVIWLASVIKWRAQNVNLHSPFAPIAFAGGLLALFALGWVFQAAPVLVEMLSPLKNFRVLGRFAWPGIYLFNVGLLAWAWRQSAQASWKRIGLIGLVSLGLVESAEWHQHLSSIAAGQTNAFNPGPGPSSNHATLAAMAQAQGCTAILPLPYFHKGSEMWDTPADEGLAATTMTASFHLGLPTMASIMSRTSVSETVEQLSLRSPFPYEKRGLEALTEEGNLLVVCRPSSLDDRETWLWKQCTDCQDHFGWSWGVLQPEALARQPLLESDHPMVGMSHVDVHFKASGIEDGEAVKEYTQLWTFEPGELPLNRELECSFWFTQDEENRPEEAFFVAVKAPSGDRWEAFNTLNRSCHFSGDSVRFSARFTPTDSTASHRFVLRRPLEDLDNVTVKHVLLRPTDVNVVDTLANGLCSVNNHMACEHLLPLSP